MRLYLLRHAIAVERGTMPDPDRPLTEAGRQKLRAVLKRVAPEIEIQRLWSSPYLRCRQTAEEAQSQFRCPLVLKPELEPGGRFEKLAWEDQTMIVGHEPDLSELAGFLLTGQRRSLVVFKKAGLAGLEWSPMGGYLLFLLSPRWA